MSVFFFNDTATTEIYTLSLHDALPILEPLIRALSDPNREIRGPAVRALGVLGDGRAAEPLRQLVAGETDETDPIRSIRRDRSEEHTSELQSRQYLVCRLLLEKKKIL